ncbi:carboxypeptidase [Pararhizobium sp. BT-229]|uniref:S10 family peptidase n=1 Tax=Pararhizobium sp. BT-229 TaxID=2986923 RepID=UPI0021F6BF4A|nr:carboxypeptidase [Pararhizobium sp. BT-229]MCV9965770.1 carboxypeptidase [Pararhizobium sp. BT-229]
MQPCHLARIFVLFLTLACASAQAQERGENRSEARNPTGIFTLIPADATTQHSIVLDTGTLSYFATAGTFDIFGRNGDRSAKIFYTAYVAKDQPVDRPVTFVFNGGPGAASAYLHLGLVGPKILTFGDDQVDGTRPSLKDNPESWLAFTDLVLIDPVGTGWSRAADEEGAGQFYSVSQDAESIAKVIALYIQKGGRLSSPKYLLGESYGGFRAAKVASALKDTQGILVSGIVMVSPLIEGRFLWGPDDDPLAAALQLPSLAAAEMERKNAFDPGLLKAAEQFAGEDYLVSLAGPAETGAAADAFYERIAKLTGIPVDTVRRTRGFLSDVYAKHSAGEDRVVSPYDAAYSVADAYPQAATERNDDPILDGYTRAYAPAFTTYARDELRFRTEMTYVLLNGDANRRWEWNGSRGPGRVAASATGDLRDLLSVIPQLSVLATHGYSDALTPYGFSRYVVDHLPPDLVSGRVTMKLYRGGHMFYTAPASRKAFFHDARSFYARGNMSE